MPPEPELDQQFLWLWRAWHRLHPDRPQYGGGMGPSVPGDIPWVVARKWARHHRMTRGEFNMLDHVFQAMDREYREWWMVRNATPAPGKGGG